MAFTAQDLADVEATIVDFARTGALTVTYSGPPSRSVTYRSFEEMKAVRDLIKGELANAAGRGGVHYVVRRKGF